MLLFCVNSLKTGLDSFHLFSVVLPAAPGCVPSLSVLNQSMPVCGTVPWILPAAVSILHSQRRIRRKVAPIVFSIG